MANKGKLFTEEHPYYTLIIFLSVSSLLGITVQYLANGDFVGEGFYSTLFFGLIGALAITFKRK